MMRLPARNIARILLGWVAAVVVADAAWCAAGVRNPDDWQSVVAAMTGDELTESEAREFLKRPLPPPPGANYESALLRKAFVANYLDDRDEVMAVNALMMRHGQTRERTNAMLGVVALAELQRGNLQSSLKVRGELERRAAASKQSGATNIYYDWMTSSLLTQIDTALDANRAEAERLLREYPDSLADVSSISPEKKIRYKAFQQRARAHMARQQGDLEGAYKMMKRSFDQYERDRQNLVGVNFVAQALLETNGDMFRVWLVNLSASRGDFSQAKRHLDDYAATLKLAGDPKTRRSRYLRTVWDYQFSIAAYDQALITLRSRLAEQTFTERRSQLARQEASVQLALTQMADGDYGGSVRTLGADVGFDAGQRSVLWDEYVAIRAYASAMGGDTKQDLTQLDALDADMSKLPYRGEALMFYVAKAVAYQRRAAATGANQDLAHAVDGGRKFSQTLRRMQASATMREVQYPKSALTAAKEAYLLAVVASMNRNGVTVEDLLDAMTLSQMSETDADIAAAALRQKEIPGVVAGDLRRLQDMQQAARGAQNDLAIMARTNDADAVQLAVLAQRADAATGELQKLLAALQHSSPALAQAIAVQAMTVAEIQAKLGSGEALASVVPTRQGTVTLLVTRTGADHRLLPLTAEQAQALTRRIRVSVTFDQAVQVPAFDTAAARDLHEQLFGWAGTTLKSVTTLTVIPGGALATVPFGLLVRSDARTPASRDYRTVPWLIRSMAIAHAPSIASWAAVAAVAAPARSRSFVAWADPDFGGASGSSGSAARGLRKAGPAAGAGASMDGTSAQLAAALGSRLPSLPETKQEAQAVAGALHASPADDIYLGAKATRSSVLALSASGVLAQKSVVMFATHGLAPGQLPGLYQPALAMAREPASAQLPLLQLDDVVGLRMNAEWVLLSACNSGSADRVGGDALSGLARGFFFAGARSLLVTHWEVESESAAAITVKTMERYSANPRLTRAQALQQTAVELIEAKRTPAEWAHPAFWAAYALVGDGRR